MKSKTRPLFKWIVILFILLTSLTTLEVALRIKDHAIRSKQVQQSTRSNYIPDNKLVWKLHDPEYFWKDKSTTLIQEKPHNTERLFLMGDSFTKPPEDGHGLSFYDQLQKNIEDNYPDQFQFFHYGVSGYSEFQHLELLKRYAKKYEPDYIFVQVYLGNDIGENGGLIKRSLGHGNKKEVTHHSEDKWNLKNKKQKINKQFTLNRWLSTHSFAYNWFRGKSKWLKWRIKGIDLKKTEIQNNSQYINTSPHILQLLSIDQPQVIQEAWIKTEAISKDIIELARTINSEIIFILIPHELQVNDLAWNDVLVKYQLNGSEFDCDLPSNRFKNFLKKNSVSCLDLTPIFKKHIQEGKTLYKGHFTLEGHTQTSQEILKAFEILLKKNP